MEAMLLKAQQLADVARHLQRRKVRLAAVRARSSKRKQLEKPCVVVPQRVPHVATIAWTGVAVVIVLALSLSLVQHIFQVPGIAAIGLRATDRQGGVVDPAVEGAFMAWHQALLGTPAFVEEVSERLESRGLAPAGGIDHVATMLANNVVLENNGEGHINILLAGKDIHSTIAVLDVVSVAMVGESARHAPAMEGEWRLTLEADPVVGTPLARSIYEEFGLPFLGRLLAVALGVGVVLVGLAWGIQGLWQRAQRIQQASENHTELYS